MEVELNKGLSDHILLTHNKKFSTQFLDFWNTTFRCRISRKMGHPQNSCPDAKKVPQRKKKTRKQLKGWKMSEIFLDEEEDYEEVDPPSNEEDQSTQENVEKGSPNHQVLGTPPNTSRQEMGFTVEMKTRDSKFHHVSESLDSYKV